jgi:hypothetical protein
MPFTPLNPGDAGLTFLLAIGRRRSGMSERRHSRKTVPV